MKMKTLSVLAGATAPLILTAQASAGFLGIKVVGKPNPFGLIVCNIYAEFDRPGEDLFTKVAGTANAPLLIQVEGGGTFFNHQFGTDRPPLTTLVEAFPSLAFDSFVTIGVKAVDGGQGGGQPFDNVTLTPGFPGISGTQLFTTNSGWAVTPDEPQANPFDPDYVAGNGQILIGQFATANGTGFSGTMLVGGVSNGVGFQAVVSFFHVPAPGALALLGIAGLLGPDGRRRRGMTQDVRHELPRCRRAVACDAPARLVEQRLADVLA